MLKTEKRLKLSELNPNQKWLIVIAGLLALGISTLLFFSLENYLITEKRELATNASNQMARQLDRHLNENLFATYALAALIKNGHGNISGFEGLAKEFIAYQPDISSLQLAPNGIIKHIVPLAGNEKAIGHNLLADEKRNIEAIQALKTKKLTLAGPFELVQGGEAVIGRLPVFLDDKESSFWGFTTALIKMKDFLHAVQIDKLAQQGFSYELWRTHPNTGKKHIIDKSHAALNGEPNISFLDVANGRWNLSITPTEGWINPNRIVMEIFSTILLATVTCWLIFLYFRGNKALESSESRYQKLYTSSPVMLHSIDKNNKIISTSKLWLDTLGYSKEEVIGHETIEFMSADSRKYVTESVLPEFYQKGHCDNIPLQLVTKAGRLIDVLLSATAERNFKNEIIGILVVMQDVTERKEIDRMKSEFVSTVSHELRTPLTSISGALSLINGGVLGKIPEQAKQMLEIAHKNSLRLTHLINDLLDMEKLVAGKMHFDMQLQSLTPIVESSMESVHAYAELYQVRFKLILPIEDTQIFVDSMRLQQVLTNFLSNAAKFSPASGQVEVAIKNANDTVRIEITDHGPGIPAEFHSRIFQKFSQADSSDTRQKGGTGLGLAISKEIIERMNGKIGFDSVEGQGACFHFELPVQDTSE
jgi:PAS domain S-box-containing protein